MPLIWAAARSAIAFTQGFRDCAREGFTGFLGHGLREPVCLRVLDVQAHFGFADGNRDASAVRIPISQAE